MSMGETMARRDDRTRLNSVQSLMAKAQINVNHVAGTRDAVDDADMLSLIATAIRRSGLKQEHLAAIGGAKPSQVSGALNGHGAFNVRWLNAWPAEFWNEYLPLLRAHKEQTADARRAQRKALLIRTIELLLEEVA